MAHAVGAAQTKAVERASESRSVSFLVAAQASLLLGDVVIACGAFLLAYRLRVLNHIPDLAEVWRLLNPVELMDTVSWPAFQPYWHLFLIVPIVRLLTLRWKRLYELKGEFSILDDGVRLFEAVTLASLIIIVMTFMYRGFFEYRQYSYSRGVFLLDWGLALLGYGTWRGVVRGLQLHLRRRGRNLISSIIVGQGDLADICLREIASRPQLGYRIIGIVTSQDSSRPGAEASSGAYPIIGRLQELPEIIKTFGIEEVFITDPNVSPRLLFETIMKSWRHRRTRFSMVPSLLHTLPRKTDIGQLGALPMLKLFQEPLSGPNRYLKRTADIIMATLGLVLLSPVFLLIYGLIKWGSPGPVLFRQERVGMDGRVFTCYKFRTMRLDADDEPHRQHMRRLIHGEIGAQSEDQQFYGKVVDDDRITSVGRVLRRYSLDELPQLFNVLKGEMSIVGPRPPIPYEVEQYSEWHRKRLDVKPGMTGLWQVSGRNRLPFDKMVELDIYYIENWSLWLDFKIMLLTIPAILRGETM